MDRKDIIRMAEECGIPEFENNESQANNILQFAFSNYERGYADAMNWKTQNYLEHLPSREPDRQWVGLTDNDVWNTYMKSHVECDLSTDDLYSLSRSIEAKLKEKNT